MSGSKRLENRTVKVGVPACPNNLPFVPGLVRTLLCFNCAHLLLCVRVHCIKQPWPSYCFPACSASVPSFTATSHVSIRGKRLLFIPTAKACVVNKPLSWPPPADQRAQELRVGISAREKFRCQIWAEFGSETEHGPQTSIFRPELRKVVGKQLARPLSPAFGSAAIATTATAGRRRREW